MYLKTRPHIFFLKGRALYLESVLLFESPVLHFKTKNRALYFEARPYIFYF